MQVYFELVGSVRSSGVMVPAATKKSFRPGGCDIFTYPQMPYVGDPLRMRIFTDGAGLFPGWHLRLDLRLNLRHLSLFCPGIDTLADLLLIWHRTGDLVGLFSLCPEIVVHQEVDFLEMTCNILDVFGCHD